MSAGSKTLTKVSPAVARSIFWWNAVTIVLIGTAVCVWAGYYSDVLPEITAVLAGGGTLVWASTAFSLLKSKQQDEARSWAQNFILAERWFTVLLLITAGVLILLANFLGSVQIEARTEEGEHSIFVHSAEKALSDSDQGLTLAPGKQVRSVVWTSWPWPKSVAVKTAGYPEKLMSIRPFQRASIVAPASFRRPILLIRPTVTVADVAKGTSMEIELTMKDPQGNTVVKTADFDGRAVLTGGDEDLVIPPELEEAWRKEVGDRLDLFYQWARPVAPIAFAMQLAPKTTVRLRLLQVSKKPYGEPVMFMVAPLRSTAPFIQEVVLYGPRKNVPPQ